jgi:hypothetical protein
MCKRQSRRKNKLTTYRKIIILFFITLLCHVRGQDLSSQLQRQMWYVKGDLYKGDTCSIHIDKPTKCSGYLLFSTDILEMYLEAADTKFACDYLIINDKLKLWYKVNYSDKRKSDLVEIFYRVVPDGHDFLLTSISKTDFK